MDTGLKVFLIFAFVMIIPVSAGCYYFSRNSQRVSEIHRYITILKIDNPQLFQHNHPLASLSFAVFFMTFLSTCFWWLVMFGNNTEMTMQYNFLLGGTQQNSADPAALAQYQSGAMLTFSMAFLGAYLWGIQNIARRYSMNDLIPSAYYNAGVRVIFACILALVFYHLAHITPELIAAWFVDVPADQVSASTMATSSSTSGGSQMLMPVVAFLIGLFPQRGLKWLTEKFSMFTHEKDPSVRDLPLEMIEGVSIYDRVRLQELGIDSCYDLANIDYIPYLFKSPYSPRELINWILQAKLCVYFGKDVKDLRTHGIHTVWQLTEYDDDALKQLARSSALTEDMLFLVKAQVTKDKEIDRLVQAQLELSKYWQREKSQVDLASSHLSAFRKRLQSSDQVHKQSKSA